jgi:hypothetical protein
MRAIGIFEAIRLGVGTGGNSDQDSSGGISGDRVRLAWVEAGIRVRRRDRWVRFLQACAAQTGLPQDAAAIAQACDIAPNTAMAWLDDLEELGLAHRLPGWTGPEIRGRGTRWPILHLTDTALACWLLGIEDDATLAEHPARQRLAESWMVGVAQRAATRTGGSCAHIRTLSGRYVPLVLWWPGRVTLCSVLTEALPAGLQNDRTMCRLAPHGAHLASIAAWWPRNVARNDPRDDPRDDPRNVACHAALDVVVTRQLVHDGRYAVHRAGWSCPTWRVWQRSLAHTWAPLPQYERSASNSSARSFK